ncbi:GNAT family N-acetyltransferase [Lactiplantibacillus carotarum]|uniref:GNAT family N-acetyltransferase n=1 Tax=Lactiplantibacillus carotarum TaxID=2993456 RepID=UPI00298ED469|nr:GNAT family N-acetyltransferase [Lactiplantibacillus carotarum]
MEIKTSNQPTSQIYADAISVRRAVFIDEQGIAPELELDEVTTATWHYVLYDDQQHAVATARMTPESDATLHVQRVATRQAARGHGYAGALIKRMMADARQRGYQQLTLGAQVTAVSFYQQLGFITQGAPFMEAGIQHRTMTYQLTE